MEEFCGSRNFMIDVPLMSRPLSRFLESAKRDISRNQGGANMRRETVSLNSRRVATILNRDRYGEEVEYADSTIEGLSLRCRKRTASWYVRGRVRGESGARTLKIGDAHELDVDEIRRRAMEARKLFQRGIHPAEWLREQEGVQESPQDNDEREEKRQTWEAMVDSYLESLISDVETGAKSHATYNDYQKLLRHDVVMRCLGGKTATEITSEDIKRVRDHLWNVGKRTQAGKVVRVISACFSWASDSTQSDVQSSPSRGVRQAPAGSGKAKKARKMLPTPLEIGQALLALETDETHSLRDRLGVLLTLHTAQRRMSVSTARVEDFNFEEYQSKGWCAWTVSHRKQESDRPHEIILLPRTAEIVRKAMVGARYGFLFPKARRRNQTDSAGGSADPSFITQCCRELKFGFSPHRIRDAFSTICGESESLKDAIEAAESEAELRQKIQGIREQTPEVKLILDHEEGKSSDVTFAHYSRNSLLAMKIKMMFQWQDYLDRCREIARKSQ